MTINKAMVQNEHMEWVIKSTKTTASTREIVISMEIADKIREQGYVYTGYPGKIANFLSSAQTKLEIPHFPLHKLRHYFASKMSAMNVPEADIMKFGGWETDYVMKGVYRHAMEDKNRRRGKLQISLVMCFFLDFVMTKFMTKNITNSSCAVQFQFVNRA